MPRTKKPKIKTRFKDGWKALWILTAMQLKDRFSFSFSADKKSAIMKIVAFILGFIVITGICYGFIYLFGFLRVFSINSFVPVTAMVVVFTVMMGLSIITCIFGLTDTLYFSEDNQVLLAYPVQPNIVFLSKLNVYYVSEIIKNFFFIIPLFIAYGVCYNFVWFYYPWIIFCFLLISLIPVIVGALLSIPFMWLKVFLKKYPIINSVLLFSLLIACFAFIVFLIFQLPENINITSGWGNTYWDIQDFLNSWRQNFSIIDAIVMLMVGKGADPYNFALFNQYTLPILGMMILGLIVFGLISFLIAKPVFFKMATKPFEYSKKSITHDFKVSKQILESEIEKIVFKIKGEEKIDETVYRNVLKKVWKENLFYRGKTTPKRILRILNSSSKYQFELIELTDFENLKTSGPLFVITKEYGVKHLVLLKNFNHFSYQLFDPIHLEKQNRSFSNPFVASLYKEVMISLRTPEIIISNFALFSIAPIAILALNRIFSAMTTKLMGNYMIIAFNILIILLIMLTSSIGFASIYSKEGKTSYLLKSAPINYTKNLLTKLIINTFIMFLSAIATGIIFSLTNHQLYFGSWLLFISIFLIYLGHVLWSAELDFMNPQDKVYATAGGSISNPNETKSAVIAFAVSIIFALIAFFLLSESNSSAFIKIFIIAAIFFAARLYLFITRIKVYNTERGELGR